MRLVALVPALAVLVLGSQHLQNLTASPAWQSAIIQTLLLAAASTALSLPIGGLAAIGLWPAPRAARRLVLGAAIITLLLPPALIAHRLPGHPAAALAPLTANSACLVLLILTSRLNTLDPSLLQAAGSLGAPKLRAWRLAMLPNLAAPLAIAAAAAFSLAAGKATFVGHPTLAGLAYAAAGSGQSDAAPASLLLLCLVGAPLAMVVGVDLVKASKAFFFEKKKQKTFANAVAP